MLVVAMSRNSGTSCGFKTNPSGNAGVSSDPCLAASGVRVFVAWADQTTGNSEILFRAPY